MLFNEPKLLKSFASLDLDADDAVSVLFNEPKLLKSSAPDPDDKRRNGFSALQRAEIAEIPSRARHGADVNAVSVLFNEPKLLKLVVRSS